MGLLTTSERDRLNRFPVQIPDEELRVFFLFSDADQTAINTQREAHTRLGFSPDALAAYGRRIPTRTLHLQHVQAHLGFRPAAPLELSALHMWLVERT